MLTKRIIPCLDVKDGMVVKGVKFQNHKIVGDVLDLAKRYCDDGADELVFYDITASCDQRRIDKQWISKIARFLDIPFTVAGGIKSIEDARIILNSGADKISINSPALQNPSLISELVVEFGSQCVVVGVDSYEQEGEYYVYQFTGNPELSRSTQRRTEDWITEIQILGAGEIVLNCMNQDGVKNGYDIKQLSKMHQLVKIPIIASGGAGKIEDFENVFIKAEIEGALAASVFHNKTISITELKKYLKLKGVEIRL